MSAMPSSAETRASAKEHKQLSRRDFLSLAGKTLLAASGILGLGELVSYLGYQPDPPAPTRFELGAASQYPPGSRTLIAEAQAVLLHTASGFKAISLVCPHLGCTLEVKPDAFLCPCHGSKFDPDGGLFNGPASQPMRSLRVEKTAQGDLVLHI